MNPALNLKQFNSKISSVYSFPLLLFTRTHTPASNRWCMHEVKSQCIIGKVIKRRGLFPIPFSILIFTAQLAPQILIPGRFCSPAWRFISLAGSTLTRRMHKYAWLWSALCYFRSVVQTTLVFSQGVPCRNEMVGQVCLLGEILFRWEWNMELLIKQTDGAIKEDVLKTMYNAIDVKHK